MKLSLTYGIATTSRAQVRIKVEDDTEHDALTRTCCARLSDSQANGAVELRSGMERDRATGRHQRMICSERDLSRELTTQDENEREWECDAPPPVHNVASYGLWCVVCLAPRARALFRNQTKLLCCSFLRSSEIEVVRKWRRRLCLVRRRRGVAGVAQRPSCRRCTAATGPGGGSPTPPSSSRSSGK